MMAAQTSEALREASREEAEQLAAALGEELASIRRALHRAIKALPDQLETEGRVHGYRERLLARCAGERLRLCVSLKELSPAGLEALITGCPGDADSRTQ